MKGEKEGWKDRKEERKKFDNTKYDKLCTEIGISYITNRNTKCIATLKNTLAVSQIS